MACHSIGGCRCSGKSHPGAIGAFPVGNHNEVLHTPDVSRYRSSGANGQRSPQKVGFEITLDWSFSWVMLAAVSRTQCWVLGKLLKGLEARAGIEPAHKGFADLSLTTWVPRLGRAALENLIRSTPPCSQPGVHRRAEWSGRRDLNSRPSPWQGDALPLSYSRINATLSIPGGRNVVKPPSGQDLRPVPAHPEPKNPPRPANPFPLAQSPRRACTGSGWRWWPPPDCV